MIKSIIGTVLLSILVVSCAGSVKTDNIATGTLYVSGNEPFTFLALQSTDNEYYKIECSDSLKKELWKLQGSQVELTFTVKNKSEKSTEIIVTKYELKN